MYAAGGRYAGVYSWPVFLNEKRVKDGLLTIAACNGAVLLFQTFANGLLPPLANNLIGVTLPNLDKVFQSDTTRQLLRSP